MNNNIGIHLHQLKGHQPKEIDMDAVLEGDVEDIEVVAPLEGDIEELEVVASLPGVLGKRT